MPKTLDFSVGSGHAREIRRLIVAGRSGLRAHAGAGERSIALRAQEYVRGVVNSVPDNPLRAGLVPRMGQYFSRAGPAPTAGGGHLGGNGG